MLDKVHKTLKTECNLARGQPVLLGVSGGPDSLAMLHIQARENVVIAAHFNHQLRAEAGEDARRVEQVCEELGVPFVYGEGSAAEMSAGQGLSVEEAARELRYPFLFGQAEKRGAQAVVVAHNADDQVETVLMHLLRGSGLDGLTGMSYRSLPNPWHTEIPLLRPLLGTWRSEIERYCEAHDLHPVVDATNADTTYFRNRLRHELIPMLDTYVPGFGKRLWQTADLLDADRKVLDGLTQAAWGKAIQVAGRRYVRIEVEVLRRLDLGLQRRLLRKALMHLRPDTRDIDFAMVQRALDFVVRPPETRQMDLGLGLRILLEDQGLILSEWETALPTGQWPQIEGRVDLPVPGQLALGDGWQLSAAIPSDPEKETKRAGQNDDPYRIWFDLGEQAPLLEVRPRQPGDRFQPLGMDGRSTNLADFMTNQKIPRRARKGWPLVFSGGALVWVPGYRLDHRFRVRGETERIVRLELKRIS